MHQLVGNLIPPAWSKNAASPVWSHGTLAAHAQRTTTRAPHLRCGVVGRTMIFPHRAARQLGHYSLWPGQNDICHPASLAGSSAVAHRSMLSRIAGPRSTVPRSAVRFVVGLGSVVAKTAHARRPAHDDKTVTLHGMPQGVESSCTVRVSRHVPQWTSGMRVLSLYIGTGMLCSVGRISPHMSPALTGTQLSTGSKGLDEGTAVE